MDVMIMPFSLHHKTSLFSVWRLATILVQVHEAFHIQVPHVSFILIMLIIMMLVLHCYYYNHHQSPLCRHLHRYRHVQWNTLPTNWTMWWRNYGPYYLALHQNKRRPIHLRYNRGHAIVMKTPFSIDVDVIFKFFVMKLMAAHFNMPLVNNINLFHYLIKNFPWPTDAFKTSCED